MGWKEENKEEEDEEGRDEEAMEEAVEEAEEETEEEAGEEVLKEERRKAVVEMEGRTERGLPESCRRSHISSAGEGEGHKEGTEKVRGTTRDGC